MPKILLIGPTIAAEHIAVNTANVIIARGVKLGAL